MITKGQYSFGIALQWDHQARQEICLPDVVVVENGNEFTVGFGQRFPDAPGNAKRPLVRQITELAGVCERPANRPGRTISRVVGNNNL